MTSLPPCSDSAEAGFSAAELAELFEGDVVGDAGRRAYDIAPLYRAGATDIAFALTRRHLEVIGQSRAGIVLIRGDLTLPAGLIDGDHSFVRVANPHAAFAQLSSLIHARRRFAPGVEDGAIVHPTAMVDSSARVCAGARIGSASRVGAGVHVGHGVFIGSDAEVGDDSYLYPHCVLMDGTRVGRRVIVHPGAVIGADGFGFAADGDEWIKLEQIGAVVIGDDVEIGANSTIDRGALDDTVIGNGVKIDNLVHIAHNVTIGDHTAIAGCVGIAGSARIGRHCAIGGGAGILGHLEIVDDVTIHAMTLVTRSIREPGSYASGVPHQRAGVWNRNLAALRRLGRSKP